MAMNEDLRRELLALRDRDLSVRQQLLERGELEGGYHPEMEAVHRANAARLREIIAEHDWPTKSVVGEDGAEAAWLIVQHAIGKPEFMRSSLPLLEVAAERGDIPKWQPAYLSDRIAFFEDRPQCYGTQYDCDDNGVNRLYECREPERLNELRASVGLGPAREPDPNERISPEQALAQREAMRAWQRRVGWLK